MYLNRHLILQYFSRKPFGVHSPFVYAFAENCVYSKEHFEVFDFLEALRQALMSDRRLIEVTDYGKGPRGKKNKKGEEPLTYRRRISSIARHSLQSPRLCRLLFRTAAYFKPLTILELGTSLGVTTAYLAKAAPQARVITLEGCSQTAGRAEQLFRESGLNNVELITGNFANTLAVALEKLQRLDMVYIDGDHSYEGVMNNFSRISEHIHSGTVLILDDIRWSKGMKRAWLELTDKPGASLSIDLFRMGVVFFNPALSKQIISLAY